MKVAKFCSSPSSWHLCEQTLGRTGHGEARAYLHTFWLLLKEPPGLGPGPSCCPPASQRWWPQRGRTAPSANALLRRKSGAWWCQTPRGHPLPPDSSWDDRQGEIKARWKGWGTKNQEWRSTQKTLVLGSHFLWGDPTIISLLEMASHPGPLSLEPAWIPSNFGPHVCLLLIGGVGGNADQLHIMSLHSQWALWHQPWYHTRRRKALLVPQVCIWGPIPIGDRLSLNVIIIAAPPSLPISLSF